MAPKIISSYPPDRWIRTLNQRYPNLWMELKKSYDDPNLPLSPAGKTLLAAVPDWCVMPTMFPCTYLSIKNGTSLIKGITSSNVGSRMSPMTRPISLSGSMP